ncbi:hypothetical protein YC2023_097754 [Brassica napus]
MFDEDINSSSEKEKEIRRKPMENMKLRRAKEADQDICAIKTPYLTNQVEFIHETGFVGLYTQQEHAANWGDPTCLIWMISGLISCKPNIGDQEIYLCNQETHPRRNRAPRPTYQSYNVFYILITHQEVYSGTSTLQNTQNQPRPELPFLESKAINSQQLFSHQDAPDYMESKETKLTIFGCFHIWRNRAPRPTYQSYNVF